MEVTSAAVLITGLFQAQQNLNLLFENFFDDSGTESDDDDDELEILYLQVAAGTYKKIPPRIHNYLELVVSKYSDAEFKENFRLSREAFHLTLQKLLQIYVGEEPIQIEKALLAVIWLLATPDSYRNKKDREEKNNATTTVKANSNNHIMLNNNTKTLNTLKTKFSLPSLPRGYNECVKFIAKPRVAVSMVLNEDKTEIIEIEEVLPKDDFEEIPTTDPTANDIQLQKETSFECRSLKREVSINNSTDTSDENENCLMIKNEEIDIKCSDIEEEEEEEESYQSSHQSAAISETSDGNCDGCTNYKTLKQLIVRIGRMEGEIGCKEKDKSTRQDSLQLKLSARSQKEQTLKKDIVTKEIARPARRKRGTGPVEHVCTICGYSTIKTYGFNLHIKLHGNRDDLEKFNCPKCTFQTIWKQKYNLHVRRHDGFKIKTTRCKKCGYETARKEGLQDHVCKNLDSYMTCYDCGYQTNSKNRLRIHVKIHRTIKEFPFRCNFCSFGTKYKVHLITHMNRHQGDSGKKFECLYCDYKTCQKGNLTRHKFVVHGEDGNVPWYHCFHCDYKTKDKYSLQMHVVRHNKRHYEEAKRLKCAECGYKTLHKNCLVLHVLKHKNL